MKLEEFESKVRHIFPEAYSWYHGLWWSIHETFDMNSPVIGTGTLEIDAWKEAEQKCNKVSTES